MTVPSSDAVEHAYARWIEAVDRLWREALWLRRARLAERERKRAERRLVSLRKIVRRALSEYHRLEVEKREHG